MATRAVVDSGPLIHLSEIGCFRVFKDYELMLPPVSTTKLPKKALLAGRKG